MNEAGPVRVAILGGSGRVGRFLVQRVCEDGYLARVLLRNPHKIKLEDKRVQIVQGDAADITSIRLLLQGADCILNALGQRKELKEPPIFSTATDYILTAMKEFGIRRYILVRGFSIDVPGDHKDFRSKLISMLVRSIVHDQWADWQKELGLLLSSDVEWTLVRLPIMVDEPSSSPVRVHLASPPGKKINGDAVAEFVVAQIKDPTYIKKAPFIGN